MNREVNSDMIAGIIGILLTAVFFFALEDVSWMSIIFPKTIVFLMAIISGLLVVKSFVRPSRRQIFNIGSNTRWLVTGTLFFLWVLVMPVFGFFVSTVVFMTAIVGYLARARMPLTIGRFLVWIPIVIAEVTFFYLIFTKVLYVPLPEGMFF
ncbi:tripartite tricarboxylate transporter TctB family protein [uncultured Desulfosarcina sp.]|uniref:tripartite tricarboxylate transporter TctB family protein n=1 Tax=uncultured Desulfosarcina sp. TaxID=218289 RepID=UPI0029C7CB88|nr:tripartite tricarboxylate transporter TctB family protein [uncultured Desulfosarcina sp.]